MIPTRVIGGNTFTVAALPAMRSFCLQPRIAPAVAEALGAIGGIVGGGDGVADRDVSGLAPAIGKFFSKLPAGELEEIVVELLTGATCDGRTLFNGTAHGAPFDLIMQGRTLDTWRLIAFAVEVNYPDFFDLLRGAAGKRPAAAASAA